MRHLVQLGLAVLMLSAVAADDDADKADSGKKKPHILFVLVDDMGWGDVSWADYPDLPTPSLQRLKDDGVELTQFYTLPKCTASRAALMTGRYPYKMGLQASEVFTRHHNMTLDMNLKLLPAYLQDQGYATHMVGKWHLGYCAEAATPTARGFDTFFGTWENSKDHFQHSTPQGYDWQWNYDDTYQPYWEGKGTYDTHLITSHTQTLLQQHFASADPENPGDTQPLFLYTAYLAPHIPSQVPDSYRDSEECSHFGENDARKTYCGMIKALDEGIGNITSTLEDLGVLDDFIIVFTSDNGGGLSGGASSWPLRGGKNTLYEGGTRTRTLIRAPMTFKDVPRQYDGLVHLIDLLPTLYVAASGDASDLPDNLDGKNVWWDIKKGTPINRKWMVYNIDSERLVGALRLKNETHNFKLIYDKHESCAGWKRDPRPKGTLFKRRSSYPCPASGYRLYDLDTNPEELEPGQTLDAGLLNPTLFTVMKWKLAELTKEEVPSPVYVKLDMEGADRPKNNEGYFAIGGCEFNAH